MAKVLKAVLDAFSGWEGYVALFAIGAVLSGLVVGPVAWEWQANRYERQLAELREGQAREVAAAVDASRLEEQRRTAAQTEIANAAKNDADLARADARTADAAADRLRQRVDQLLAADRTGKDSGAAGGGQSQPGGDPLDVLVGVLERSDRASGILAKFADQLKIAGLACERGYDSLAPAR